MPFGLTIGTERANALQNAIQDELAKRGYSNDSDFVMAEYITIMIINNKTSDQISNELEDLIGSEYDRNFTDWLFEEAAKGAPDAQVPVPIAQRPQEPSVPDQSSQRDPQSHTSAASSYKRQGPSVSRPQPLYQQAISQTFPTGTKRTASARSPSPSSGHGPNKARRTDLPAGPRAMFNRENGNNNNNRSLLERVGPRGAGGGPSFEEPPRFDGVNHGNFQGGMGGMDMNGIAAAAMTNPLVLQEMMMNQMALMTQMAGAMGMMNPVQFGMNPGAQGFPDMSMMNGMNVFSQQQQMGGGRGRPGGRSGAGRGRDRGGAHFVDNRAVNGDVVPMESSSEPQPTPIVAPQPTQATPSQAPIPTRTGYLPPERPQSPTLCKFGLKCTNASCRFSHPSPVATPESGVVLSNDHCEQGKACKDKDCIKAHVSPAVLNPKALEQNRPASSQLHLQHQSPQPQSHVACRYGLSCARIHSGCPYTHPSPKTTTPCRFGAACTRASCTFQHPEGRVLPTTFHMGLAMDAPNVSVITPQPGTIGAPSPHKSLTLNKEREKEELERKMKELEKMKAETQQKVNQAKAAAAAKKEDGSKPVAIAV